MKIANSRLFYQILQMESPKDILNEVQAICSELPFSVNIASITYAFLSTVKLFQGRYAGYLACNTNYHDLCHTTETFLAMARLIDGAVKSGEEFNGHEVVLWAKRSEIPRILPKRLIRSEENSI